MRLQKFLLILVDTFFILISFLFVAYLKPATLTYVLPQYYSLFFIYLLLWIIVSLISDKYTLNKKHKLSELIFPIIKSDFAVLAIISVLVYAFRLPTYSRLLVFGTALITFVLEFIVSLSFYVQKKVSIKNDFLIATFGFLKSIKLFYFFLIFDAFIFTFSFLISAWLKPATVSHYLPVYSQPIILLGLFWIFTSLLSDKYNLKSEKSILELIAPIIRSDITFLALISILIYAFHFYNFSRLIIFGTILISFVFEIIFCILYYYHQKLLKTTDYSESHISSVTLVEPEYPQEKKKERHLRLPKILQHENSISYKLKEKYLTEQPALFNFIHEKIPIQKIPKNKSYVINTHTFFNVENIDKESQYFFLNLHKTNDIRRINKYFIQINKNLKSNAYFVGSCETIAEIYKRYFKKYPRLIAVFFYSLHFILHRIFPKIPILKEIYFILTKGENRSISQSEVLGRLYFCGFKVIDTIEIDNLLYFITQKVKEPKKDISPSYGPLIKMRRIGKDSKIFYVYKFRTMHPYSEYLQEYIYEKYQLEESGKFKNDFRVTGWGKVFRKLWIDELPQLINFFRGELNLFGVRALSQHYFSLYPDYLQKLRTKFKPGLVPPFYADLPTTFEEILESEKKYLESKQIHRYSTDMIYLWKAAYNIIFKHARSN